MFSILDSATDHTPDGEVPDFFASCLSKLSLDTFPALHDGIIGRIMEENARTAKYYLDLRTLVAHSRNGARGDAEASAGKPATHSARLCP